MGGRVSAVNGHDFQVNWGLHEERSGDSGRRLGGLSGAGGTETMVVREMSQQLEEAVEVAQKLRQEKVALQRDVNTLRLRSVASRKIAEKARLGEKDLSESLSTLSGEHRDLVDRLIQQRQENSTKSALMRTQATASAKAVTHLTQGVIRKMTRDRLRRATLLAWKMCAVDSLLQLLAKSALVSFSCRFSFFSVLLSVSALLPLPLPLPLPSFLFPLHPLCTCVRTFVRVCAVVARKDDGRISIFRQVLMCAKDMT